MITVTKQDLIRLGYGNSYAANIMREAKKLMIKKGFVFYESKKLNSVPREAVEEVLGMALPNDVLFTSPKNKR